MFMSVTNNFLMECGGVRPQLSENGLILRRTKTALPKRTAEISAVPWGGHNLFHGPSFPAHVGVRRSPWHPCVVTKHWSGPKRPGTERTRCRWRPGGAILHAASRPMKRVAFPAT